MKRVAIVIGFTAAIVGCGTSSPPPVDADPADLIEVELQLNWYPEAEHGGYYAALVHGYFEDEGLRVTIKPGGPSVPVLAQVASGRAAFGVSNAHQVLLGHAEGAKTTAVMAPLQNCPRCAACQEILEKSIALCRHRASLPEEKKETLIARFRKQMKR